jgi:hypothetical protein
LRYEAHSPRENALKLGQDVAQWLMLNGGAEILKKVLPVNI